MDFAFDSGVTVKILMLTPRFPFPPTRGDCIRAWGELSHLAARHGVWLASLAESQPVPADLENVRGRCRDVAIAVRGNLMPLIRGGLSLLRGETLTGGYFQDARLAGAIESWTARVDFDAVLVFSSGMAQYSSLVPGARRVLDMNDVDSVKWRRYSRTGPHLARPLYALEARRLARAERAWCSAHDVTVVVNRREQRRLEALCEHASSAVIRTGVECPTPASPREVPGFPRATFVGSMSYAPNIRAVEWFAKTVWPRIRAAQPSAEWTIVGRAPTRAVRRLARLPGVHVTGPVADVEPFLRDTRVFVAPMRDDLGVQTKLIHALAHGVPAVCSPAAAAGMDWDGEPPFLIADSPVEFADSVVRVLTDDALAQRLSTAAVRNVAAYYDVRRQAAELESLLSGRATTPAAQIAAESDAGPVVLAPSAATRLAG